MNTPELNEADPLSKESLFQRTENALLSEIDGDVVGMHINNDVYFRLNAVGSFIWKHLEHPIGFESLVERIVSTHAVDKPTASAEVTKFLTLLIEKKLVETTPSASVRGN